MAKMSKSLRPKRGIATISTITPHVGLSLPHDVIAVLVLVDDNGFLRKKRDPSICAPLRTQRL